MFMKYVYIYLLLQVLHTISMASQYVFWEYYLKSQILNSSLAFATGMGLDSTKSSAVLSILNGKHTGYLLFRII
jgi:hypothetical protein